MLHELINSVIFLLSSVSSSLEFWQVNHTSIQENFELKVFKNIKLFHKSYNDWPNNLFGANVYRIDQIIYSEQMYTRLLNFVDNYCYQDCNKLPFHK